MLTGQFKMGNLLKELNEHPVIDQHLKVKEILEGWVGDDRFVKFKCLYLSGLETRGIARTAH